MKMIADGKDALLTYLEQASQQRVGSSDHCMLGTDDSGMLYATIGGHIFIGTGTVTLGGRRISIVDGIVVDSNPRAGGSAT